MGKALLLFVLALSTLFSTGILNLNRYSLESVSEYSDHYRHLEARNAAVSGIYMSFSKLYQEPTWRGGFNSPPLSMDGSTVNVDIYDKNNNANLLDTVKIKSSATYENVSKIIEVALKMLADLDELAIFTTDTIDNVETYNENGDQDSSLMAMNAPEMIPFDKGSLLALAQSQGYEEPGPSFTPPNNWPNGSFYYNVADSIPNVTYVHGNLIILGGRTVYGIYVVEGNVEYKQVGNSSVYGVIYLPEPGSVLIKGGGNPGIMCITGGIFANGPVQGTGNHIDVKYNKEYMTFFGEYRFAKNMYILRWKESVDL